MGINERVSTLYNRLIALMEGSEIRAEIQSLAHNTELNLRQRQTLWQTLNLVSSWFAEQSDLMMINPPSAAQAVEQRKAFDKKMEESEK
jgi:hypothetical protein